MSFLKVVVLQTRKLGAASHMEDTETEVKTFLGASLVAQWLRIRQPMQGTRV